MTAPVRIGPLAESPASSRASAPLPLALILGAAALAVLVTAVPFLLTQTPALMDYPNHLARLFILENWEQDPFLRDFYRINWGVLPNLGFDLAGLALHRILSIFTSGQAVIVAAIVLIGSGVVAVSASAHGRPRLFSVFGALFIVSQPFLFGFINLELGFGLALWGVAGWLWLRERSPIVLLAIFVPFALLLFFVHLFAFAAYGVVLAGIEIGAVARSGWRMAALRRAVLLGMAQAGLPAALLIFASPTPAGASSMGDHLTRLRTIVMAPFRIDSDVLDVATFLAAVAFVGIGLLTRRLQVARDLRLPLILLAVLCLLMPSSMATSQNAAMRLPVFACLLLAGSGSWRAPSRFAVSITAAIFALLLVARSGVVASHALQGAHFVAEVRRSLERVPQGARIAAVTVTTPEAHRTRAEWLHVICYAVIDRSAFVPSLFAFPEQQPVVLAPRLAALAYPPEQHVSRSGRPLSGDLFANIDYLLVINHGALQAPLPAHLTPLESGRDFRLYAVGATLAAMPPKPE